MHPSTTPPAFSVHPERLWMLPPALLSARSARLIGTEVVVFQTELLSHPRMAFLHDHVVLGKPLLPATAMCDALLSALCILSSGTKLSDVCFVKPLALGSVHARLQVTVDLTSGAMELLSGDDVLATANATAAETANTQQHVLLALDTRLAAAALGSVANVVVSGDGHVLPPAPADAMLQLGVVPRGSSIKIPVAATMVTAAYDAALAEHSVESRAAACSRDGTVLRLEDSVGMRGLQTTTRAPSHVHRPAMYDTCLVVGGRADTDVVPKLRVHTSSPLDSMLAALAAAQQHEVVAVEMDNTMAASAMDGVARVARRERMVAADTEPTASAEPTAAHPVLRPSSLPLPLPYRLEARGNQFDALEAVALPDQTPGPGQLVVQVEVR